MQALKPTKAIELRPGESPFRRLKGRVVHSSQGNTKKAREEVGGDEGESRAEFAGLEVHVQVDLFGYA